MNFNRKIEIARSRDVLLIGDVPRRRRGRVVVVAGIYLSSGLTRPEGMSISAGCIETCPFER